MFDWFLLIMFCGLLFESNKLTNAPDHNKRLMLRSEGPGRRERRERRVSKSRYGYKALVVERSYSHNERGGGRHAAAY